MNENLSIIDDQGRYTICNSKKDPIFYFNLSPIQNNCSCDIITGPCFPWNVKAELYKEKLLEILKDFFISNKHTIISSLHSNKQKEVINLFKEAGFIVSNDFKYRSAYNDGDILFLMYTKRKASE